jgi:tetratricopeptide (TPR) repeat protein
MIVRDEATMIDACLASVRGLVSEMIVVDTGSTDDTRERARRAGAKVFDAVWTDDFSHARNLSLAHATGDWILVLDADERLHGADFATVKRLLERGAFDCAMLSLHDAEATSSSPADVVAGRARLGEPQRVPRLIRRDRHLRYVGAIHEDLGPWIVQRQRRVASLDLDIVHYGATAELYADRGKFERNVRLLAKLAAAAPQDPTPLGYLSHQYLQNGRTDEALRAADEGWRRLRFVEGAPGYRPSVLRLTEARAQLQLTLGDVRGALETVQRARRIEGAHCDLDFLAGYALELLAATERDPSAREGFLRSAERCFRACVASAGVVHFQSFVIGATGWAAWTRLGSVALQLEELEKAGDAFRRSLALRPDGVEARLGLLEVTLHQAGGQAALGVVGDLSSDPQVRATPDFWILAAAACEVIGALDDMATFLAQARAQTATYVAGFRRRLHAERVASLAMYRGSPMAASGLVGAIGSIAARSSVAPVDVGAWPSKLPVVRILVRNLSATGRISLATPFLEPRANVIVPGLSAHVRQIADELGIVLDRPPSTSRIEVRGSDAEFVASLLSSHPRLERKVFVVAEDAKGGADARIVDAGVSRASEPIAVTRVSRSALFLDPVVECDRLLATLGEGDARPLVRYLAAIFSSAA